MGNCVLYSVTPIPQGYCPWTIVHRGGLLLPGDPSWGIVRCEFAYAFPVRFRVCISRIAARGARLRVPREVI